MNYNRHLKKFEPLYEEMNIQNKSIYVFRFAFFLRRTMLVAAIVCLKVLAFQLLVGFGQSVMMVIIIGYNMPYEDKSKWIKELINEQIILATIYFAMCFSPLVPSIWAQTIVGYMFIGMLAIHVGVNLLMMFFLTVKEAIANFKRNRFLKTHLRKLQERINAVDKAKRRQRVREFILRQKADYVDLENRVLEELETTLKENIVKELDFDIFTDPLATIVEADIEEEEMVREFDLTDTVFAEDRSITDNEASDIEKPRANADPGEELIITDSRVVPKQAQQESSFEDTWDIEDTYYEGLEHYPHFDQ